MSIASYIPEIAQREYYKVLKNNQSFHGGNFKWSLPTQDSEGNWTPGGWTPTVYNLLMCNSGYHLTKTPALWYAPGATVYKVEYAGEVISGSDDKIAVQACRLVRPLTDDELARLNIFRKGSHTASGEVIYIEGTAEVRVKGRSRVNVYNKGSVNVEDSAVYAYDNARVNAYDCHVYANDNARVDAYGSSTVSATGHAYIRAENRCHVALYRNAKAELQGECVAMVMDDSQVHAFENSSVRCYGRAQVYADDFATIRVIGGASRVFAKGIAVIRTHQSINNIQVEQSAVCIYKNGDTFELLTAENSAKQPTVKG